MTKGGSGLLSRVRVLGARVGLTAVAALCSFTASAQTTVQERTDKARTEINVTENAAARAVSAIDRKDYPKARTEANAAKNAASRALYAIDQLRLALAPPPANPTPTVAGQVPLVTSGLDPVKLTHPYDIPGSAKPDNVGAFRFLCSAGQISYDDPIVWPGQPGKAHLHQFFGNLSADASSTYETLRARGDSTCHNELNRSAYWMPAMLDGKGNVVRPDYVSVYYKRRPASDPWCTTGTNKGCVELPRGLRFVVGWDQSRPGELQPENAALLDFKCVKDWTPTTTGQRDMDEVTKVCGPGSQLMAQIHTPDCWDGRNLDSPNHRDHVAQMVRDGSTGQLSCPASHPYNIAQFTMGVVYSIEVGDNPTLWRLSSDAMIPEAIRRAGASFHSDWLGAWEDSILKAWHDNCINKLLNCSDGNLGDGRNMVRNQYYPVGKASPRLVPVPENHGAHS